jgi:enoyl-CoA hydratase/carnithine racemase
MNEDQNITVSVHHGIMQIGINRPEKKNALTKDMYDAMRHTLLEAEKNPDIKVVLIHGTHDAFSAGNDLKGFDNRDPDTPSPGAQFLTVLHAFKKPVVAAVSGIAVGVGATLLLHCDLVYAAPDTRFRMPFINLGVIPEAGSTLLLPANAGQRLAAEVLLLGDFFNTRKAIDIGLVNEVVSTEDLLGFAIEKAEQLAQKPQQALMLTKQMMKRTAHQPVAEHMALEFKHFGELLLSPESIAIRAKMKNRNKKNEQ